MKTISDMLNERDRERQREVARAKAWNLASLIVMAALLGVATACTFAVFLAAIRLVEFAPSVGGLTP